MPMLLPPNDGLPERPMHPVVFLAGSIEMGTAQDWQARVNAFVQSIDPHIFVCNPRRTHWDSSWEQKADNPLFAQQVNWELDHLQRADIVVFYFQPGTQSPITLMELGHTLADNKPMQTFLTDPQQTVVVCCPEGFWRKGNVDIMCQRSNIEVHDTMDNMLDALQQALVERQKTQ